MRYIALILLIPLALSAQATKTGRGGNPAGGNPGAANTAPPPPPPTPTADLASIEGQIFNAVGGTPLRKATITASRINNGPVAPGARSSYVATTDAGGRYTITGMEPGAYRLNANHTGFLSMSYNARRPDGPGTSLDFGKGERKTGVDFRLTPHGVISGKITDEDGDPLENVQIQLMRIAYSQGRKQLQQNNGANTNDLGEYRLSGVTPGKYYVSATYRNRSAIAAMVAGVAGAGASPPDTSSAQEDYVATFYPGVTDISAASPIEMGPGDQAQGVNIRLNRTHTVAVSGRVIDSTAPPAPPPQADAGRGGSNTVVTGPDGQIVNMVVPLLNSRIQLRLVSRNALNSNGILQTVMVGADGVFRFPSVSPGPYYLVAINNQGGRAGSHAAKQTLDVGNSNLEGVSLTIAPGATVSGHVHYDGDPPSPLPSLTVSLRPRENTAGMPAPQPAKVDPDGNFRFDDVNLDLYDVNINTPAGLYLKSLRNGNTDALVSGLDLGSGAASLDILMGLNPPVVAGSVLNPATQQPAPAVTVLLMPREKERQGSSRFYSTTNTDQYGNFTFNRVIPGSYDVYAWEDVQNGQWFDPDWMKPYEGKGEPINAQEGSPVNLKLTMIPAK